MHVNQPTINENPFSSLSNEQLWNLMNRMVLQSKMLADDPPESDVTRLARKVFREAAHELFSRVSDSKIEVVRFP
jgi:hypothetical protein